MPKPPNPKKAERHVRKADALLEKGKLEKALKHYRKALAADPDHPDIYDKLLAVQDKLPGDWEMADFAESMSWVMDKQEREHPPIRQIHARLSPEWKQAAEQITRIMIIEDDAARGALIEELVAMGEIATRAAIGLMLDFKKASTENIDQEPNDEG